MTCNFRRDLICYQNTVNAIVLNKSHAGEKCLEYANKKLKSSRKLKQFENRWHENWRVGVRNFKFVFKINMLSWSQVMEHFLKSSFGKLFFLLQVFWSLISSFFYVANKCLFQFSHHRKKLTFHCNDFLYLISSILLYRFLVFKSFIHVSNIVNLSGASLVMRLIDCIGLLTFWTFWQIRRTLRFWVK